MGGVIGHIQHPFENLSLTFGDLYDLVGFITSGKYSDSDRRIHHLHATEKLDGQQLSISWINDRGLVVARNKGHVKKFGETALGRDALVDKFHSHVCFYAFIYAYDSLDSVISDLTTSERNTIFENGRKWMSLEVIYPDTTNVIFYDKKLIFFHYTVRYDQDGNFLNLYHEDGQKLFEMLSCRHVENYTFEAPRVVKTADISRWNMRFFNQLKDIMNIHDLNPNQTIGEYLERHFLKILDRHLNFTDTGTIRNKILCRFVYGDKSFTLPQIKKIDEDLAEWVKTYEKEELRFELKYALMPLEKCFLELGTLLFHHTDDEQFLVKGNVLSTKLLIEKVLKAFKISSIVDQKINHQIYLLEEISIAVPDYLQATEGIVFDFKDELYKLTGTFAPINILLGRDKYIKNNKL